MILSALNQVHTVLVLGLLLESLITFRENIFHINTLSFLYTSKVRHHRNDFLLYIFELFVFFLNNLLIHLEYLF
jgi:hypothetical protein